MFKILNYISIVIIITIVYGCFNQNQSYDKIILVRNNRDTILGYKNIKVGASITTLDVQDTTVRLIQIPNLTEYNVEFNEVLPIEGPPSIVPFGNIKVSVELNDDKIIKCINVEIENYNQTVVLQSLIRTYIKKMGIFSYYEETSGTPGSALYAETRIVPTNAESIENILYQAVLQMKRIKEESTATFSKPHSLRFGWEWNNQVIVISSYSYDPNKSIHIYYMLNRHLENNNPTEMS